MAEQARGERAAALLRDPLIKETFDALEEKYINDWKDSSTVESRETLFQMYQALMVVRDHLTEVVETGNLAKLEINLQRNPKRR
jgi:dimeric dUTPase (all-alpha-NTP-PPase superfamily)